MSDSELLRSVVRAIRAANAPARTLEIAPETSLFEDLPLDSLDLVAATMHLQDEHGIEMDLDAVPEFRHVSDLMAELARRLVDKASAA